VKLTMLEPIGQILHLGSQFDWVEYLVVLISSNCIDYQEYGQAIKFPTLLVWFTMSQVDSVKELEFTLK
jgi:hypothetical protein